MLNSEQREPLRFTVMGPVRGWRGDIELVLGPPQQRAVLAILLLRVGQPVEIREIMDVLWGPKPPDSGINVVHRQIGRLRRLLEPGLPNRAAGQLLVRGTGGYHLNLDREIDVVDVHLFQDLVEQARLAAERGAWEHALRGYDEALALRQGPTGAGTAPDVLTHPLFTAVDREYLSVVGETADIALRAGVPERVLAKLRHAADRYPFDESLQARLVLALGSAGHRAEALNAYHRARSWLADELGIDPGRSLREAQVTVLRQQAQAVTAHETMPAGPEEPPYHMPEALSEPIVRPAQLPADLPTFAGRERELGSALALLPDEHQPQTSMLISTISGMAGVGKTTLAVHWAHRIAHRFPDGQLYANLRGFDSARAMPPTEALRGFLDALGVSPERIPTDQDAQVALFRSILFDRRVLILLDNARDAQQVRPLLPGAPGCLVIATSRDRLFGLVAAAGARHIGLDVLSSDDARQALISRLGVAQVQAEPRAVDEIVALCGHLPLALAIVAARAATHPGFALTAIAAELRSSHNRLDAFATADPLTDVRTAFSWSYGALNPAAARLFRLLAVHPGPEVSERSAASVAGLPLDTARPLLAELVAANLFTEHRPGRYSYHDLLRAYAMELGREHDAEADRHAALRRMYDYYLYTAHIAARLFSPTCSPVTLDPVPAEVCVEELTNHRQASAWFTAERPMLLAIITHAAGLGFAGYAWPLGWAVEHVLDRRGHWYNLATAYGTGLPEIGEPFLFGGDNTQQGYVYRRAGRALEHEGRLEEALDHARQALTSHRASADRAGEAAALYAVGWYQTLLGRHQQALAHYREALALLDATDQRRGEADVWDGIGHACHQLGYHRQAVDSYQRALALYRELGVRHAEAETLVRLGDTHSATGDMPAAGKAWADALCILEELQATWENAPVQVPPGKTPVQRNAATAGRSARPPRRGQSPEPTQ